MFIACNVVPIITKEFNLYSMCLMRCRHTKHWNPKYKKERKEKVIKVDLSDYENNEISPELKRTKLKERGIFPQRTWLEKPMYISCTGSIFEQYIPPEGDGKFSALTSSGAKQNVEYLTKKTKSYRAIKKIQNYEEEFHVDDFANKALQIYIDAHNTLVKNDKRSLTEFVTEKLFPEMLYNVDNKTIVWQYIKTLEPPKVVHARCTSLLSNDNLFAQVTVRLHSEQILAIYDRFGRVMNGSEILKKDVLEYIVLEKHISNQYGRWRLHSKIIPAWMPLYQSLKKTFIAC